MRRTRDAATSHGVLVGAAMALSLSAQQWLPTGSDPPGDFANAVTDRERGHVLLFSGPRAETWTWDGSSWSQLAVSGPPPRRNSSMCVDPVGRRVVLFGGLSNSSYTLDDTWAWNGSTWTQLAPATRPLARMGAGIAWDAAGGRVLLFGGVASGFPRNDTWALVGNAWLQLAASQIPVSGGPLMCDDPVRGRIVLAAAGITYEWVGGNWVVTGQSPSTPSMLAFDDANGRPLWLGSLNDAWHYDNGVWRRHVIAGPVPAARSAALAWDPGGEQMLLVGGRESAVPGAPIRDTWVLRNDTWTELTPVRPQFTYGAAADIVRDRVVAVSTQGTWEHGDSWQLRDNQLSFADYTPMVFDLLRARTLACNSVTLAWDGTTWTQLTTPIAPSARSGHAVAYDVIRGMAILFGGRSLSQVLDDTWEFDGTQWQRQLTGLSPPATSGHALGHDMLRQRTVLFGGTAGPITWEYDGTTWAQRFPTIVPPNRTRAALLQGTGAPGLVLTFGLSSGPIRDTWEWNGTNWRSLGTVPVECIAGIGLHDGHRIVATDGTSWWRLTNDAADHGSVIGTGCSGSNGVPRLDANDRPWLGNLGFDLMLDSALAATHCAMFVAPTLAATTIGACTVHLLDPQPLALGLTNSTGRARFRLPIPDDPSLRGVTVHVQGAVLDPQGELFGGIALTAARTLHVGD